MDDDDPARKYLPKPKAEKPPKAKRPRRSVGVLDEGDWVLIGVILAPALLVISVTENFTNPWAWVAALGCGGGMLVMIFGARQPEATRQPLIWIGAVLLLLGVAVPAILEPF
ncbi:hypothetical protein [Roseicyclus amphidinii]|uniref:hypothetical protein n=1 Tax=Roseicyclus amphidinii TaxID=3034232 RepID=UPI0024E11E47|nr:hypothetical protein [Roseicyclus sp. Amp-Y-6]